MLVPADPIQKIRPQIHELARCGIAVERERIPFRAERQFENVVGVRGPKFRLGTAPLGTPRPASNWPVASRAGKRRSGTAWTAPWTGIHVRALPLGKAVLGGVERFLDKARCQDAVALDRCHDVQVTR